MNEQCKGCGSPLEEQIRAAQKIQSVLTTFKPSDTSNKNMVLAEGRKDDTGKNKWLLLFQGMPRALKGVVKILMFGAKKYAPHSWQQVPEGIPRYADAINRHWMDMMEHGFDHIDEESGLPTVDHLACDVLFLSELIRKQYIKTADTEKAFNA